MKKRIDRSKIATGSKKDERRERERERGYPPPWNTHATNMSKAVKELKDGKKKNPTTKSVSSGGGASSTAGANAVNPRPIGLALSYLSIVIIVIIVIVARRTIVTTRNDDD